MTGVDEFATASFLDALVGLQLSLVHHAGNMNIRTRDTRAIRRDRIWAGHSIRWEGRTP